MEGLDSMNVQNRTLFIADNLDIMRGMDSNTIDIICTAYGFLDHSLKEDCAIMTISLKGVSNGETKNLHP